MRVPPPTARLGALFAVRLIVELEAGDPITGWLEPVGGQRERFEGLLQLLTTLDRLRSGGDPPTIGDEPAAKSP